MEWECVSVKDGAINDPEVWEIKHTGGAGRIMEEIKKANRERDKKILEIINGNNNQHSNRR